ncbi:hypothetical protein [Roseibium album]|uniref:hypothetical protein n=1 Tax=Roseibium album TaxID=311410 RepID=UPI00391AE990
MIQDKEARRVIANALGNALNDLVRDRMRGLVEEPDITSRIGQRLEDRFDGVMLEDYRVRIITETITSHGPRSLEKPTGMDLYFAISVEDDLGNEVTKGILVQAKRGDKTALPDLVEQSRRMNKISKKGSVIWVYSPNGISVLRSVDVSRPIARGFGVDNLFERVFECELGDLRRVPKGRFGDRENLKEMIEELGAKNAVWLDFKWA